MNIYQFGNFVHPLIKQFGITGDTNLLAEVFSGQDFGGEILYGYTRDLGENTVNNCDERYVELLNMPEFCRRSPTVSMSIV